MSSVTRARKEPISRRLYNEVMMLDDFTCVYCGLRSAHMSIDHIIPESLGGPTVVANLVACCAPCNGRKSTRALHEVKMGLLFGRFSYIQSIALSVRSTANPDNEELVNRIRVLVDRGLTANAVHSIVGGTRARVLAIVAQLRSDAEIEQTKAQID
jgi:hypothetical protein